MHPQLCDNTDDFALDDFEHEAKLTAKALRAEGVGEKSATFLRM